MVCLYNLFCVNPVCLVTPLWLVCPIMGSIPPAWILYLSTPANSSVFSVTNFDYISFVHFKISYSTEN